MKIAYGDLETFSECDLRKHGTHRYAAHPTTEIMVWQWALEDGEPVVEDLTSRKRPSAESVALLNDPDVMWVFHNSAFDRNLMRYVWGIDIPVERFIDTMVQAMAHSLPGSLEKIGPILGVPLDQQKDKRGKELIRLLCKPRPANQKLRRATPETHPDEWEEFLTYSYQDIISMRAIHKRLPKWNYRPGAQGTPGGREYDLWLLDQKINDRGFAIDLQFAAQAVATAVTVKQGLRTEISDATDGVVSSATKRDVLLKYLLEEHGVSLPDLTADTLRRRLEDPELPEHVKLLISIRMEAGMASSSKYSAALAVTSEDGRLRNGLQFSGALRTQRWAGRMFQPHNMKRPDPDMKKRIPQLVEATKLGVLELYEDEPMRALANAVRGCIVAPFGKKLTIADLSNIEGRKLAWLAGEEWKLQAFRDYDTIIGEDERGKPIRKGHDLYVLAYARAFNVKPETVDDYMRQIGKVMELALGYQGGVGAFLTFAAVYNMDLDELADAVWHTASDEAIADAAGRYEWTLRKRRSVFGLSKRVWIACQVLVTSWREAHPMTVQLWADAEGAVRSAIANQGVAFEVGRHIKVQRDKQWLRVRLPSGRQLCYLHPQVSESGQITYAGVNQYTRQWGRIKSYGGKFVENWDQASARDVLAWNMPAIEEAGYPLILTVHDENLTETPDKPEYTWQKLAAMMATVPPWAGGLPLAAAGFETYRYKKD